MIRESISFIKKYGYVFFLIKSIEFIVRSFNFKIILKLKGLFYFKTFNIKMGKNILINNSIFTSKIGKNITFYPNTIFEFGIDSEFSIGDNTLLSYGVIVSCKKKISIGNDCQIGEYTSLRDTTHDYSNIGIPMKYNPDISKEIIIGNNVWIGRGCIIMPGTIIEDGVVVGANSIVKGYLVKDSIYAGSPLKVIKKRN